MSGQERTGNEPEPAALTSKATPRFRRWMKWVFVAAIVGGLMYACRGDKTYHWQEEVVLSSGERLLLDRSVRLERISAPFNPFKTEWAWRESTIGVRDGPADLKGAQYEPRLLPMLIDRDRMSRDLTVVAIPVTCGVYKAYAPDRGGLYLAFRLSAGKQMKQASIPEWAWERRSNLLKPNYDKPPPRRVTLEFADRFNRKESRGELDYFVVRSETPTHCR